jgi:hypothetical protein
MSIQTQIGVGRATMSSIISEIIIITVDPGFNLDSVAFAKCRNAVVEGGVREQYYGISMDEPNKLLWVIRESHFLPSSISQHSVDRLA